MLHEREEKLAIEKKTAQIEEEKEGAETKRMELEQALEEFVRSTDKRGKLTTPEKKGSLEQGEVERQACKSCLPVTPVLAFWKTIDTILHCVGQDSGKLILVMH